MKIFPAIDIKDKKCVRLVKGDFDNKTEYEISPIDQAGKYKDYGFKNLHIVDLDGALTGETINLDSIKEIVSEFDLKIASKASAAERLFFTPAGSAEGPTMTKSFCMMGIRLLP